MNKIAAIIKTHSAPLVPRPTGVAAKLAPLAGIRAVMFDVYGTLVISGSGDIGTASDAAAVDAVEAAFEAVDLSARGMGSEFEACLLQTIRNDHERSRQRGIEFPEVDIVEIWRQTLDRLVVEEKIEEIDLQRLAIEFEVRKNPVWPMPGAGDCLARLREGGLALGLISNAQFFTPELFPALFDQKPQELGMAADLQFFSYQYGEAKPGERLYRDAIDSLNRKSIPPEHVLYVGNDMRNDIRPASVLGFRTALFAGDARSLRLREDDPGMEDVTCDLVVTDLLQLIECLPDLSSN